ncbi:tetratricopeptide repeat protein [Thermus sp. FJN-A]
MVVRPLLVLPLWLGLAALAFPLRSEAFRVLVADSYREVSGAPAFLPWLEEAYARVFGEPLDRALQRQKARGNPLEAARWAFVLVKRLLPRFSLEEGYEFAYAALKGERQCLLQAVLVQGLLQEAGFSAGVFMVWRNPEGKESNLGHAVAVLRLRGRDYLVDPSEPIPFPRHQGLFVETAEGYRFVVPVYARDGSIVGYRFQGRSLRPEEVRPLSFAFLRSQFYYYRGEQARGGVFAKPPTPTGLKRSLTMLERATALDPKNPLARYVLGLTKRKLRQGGRADLEAAYHLYQAYGHVPEGPARALRTP